MSKRGRGTIAGAILCIAAVTASGCADTPDEPEETAAEQEMAAQYASAQDAAGEEVAAATAPVAAGPTAMSKAADLRAALDVLLTEHLTLSAAATGAALGGRQSEFQAAAVALDRNSIAVSKAIGSIYGLEVEKTFLELWREHIDLLVDYTIAVGTNDAVAQEDAVSSMSEYAADFANFLSTANPDLPRAAVTDLLRTHVVTLKAVVDAQAANDHGAAYTAQHVAHDHMGAVAAALAETIVRQYPQNFE
jgi:hypothetical protein